MGILEQFEILAYIFHISGTFYRVTEKISSLREYNSPYCMFRENFGQNVCLFDFLSFDIYLSESIKFFLYFGIENILTVFFARIILLVLENVAEPKGTNDSIVFLYYFRIYRLRKIS